VTGARSTLNKFYFLRNRAIKGEILKLATKQVGQKRGGGLEGGHVTSHRRLRGDYDTHES
jgi:hypothetical protein